MDIESKSRNTFIIAEAGVNHNGSLDLAIELCNKAKEVGADAIKFQTWITSKIIVKGTPQALYQQKNTKKNIDQYSLLQKLELSFREFEEINKHCKSLDLKFLSTPDDLESLNFLIDKIGLDIIKIGSGEVTNIPFLRKIGELSTKVILSTGMCNIKDIEIAVKALGYPKEEDLIILHCTSSYPCDYKYANLNVINTLKKIFNYEIGFSDHTLGITASIGAVALGAKVIEKHFTLDKSMPGPDHLCSLEPNEFKDMVNQIRILERSLGENNKTIQDVEKDTREKVIKKILASTSIKKGDIFDSQNITLLRSADGQLNGQNWDNIIGKRSKREYKKNQFIYIDEID